MIFQQIPVIRANKLDNGRVKKQDGVAELQHKTYNVSLSHTRFYKSDIYFMQDLKSLK